MSDATQGGAGEAASPPNTSKFCPRCGTEMHGGRFCIQCGLDVTAVGIGGPSAPSANGSSANITEAARPGARQRDPDDGTHRDPRPAFADRSEAADDRIGMIVAGRYRVESILGRGGFGTVYRGKHLAIGEPVAIKFLHAELATHAELRARFRREAKALARLRHPGIVAVHDFGEEAGTLYLVMELVAGEPLQKLLRPVDGRVMETPRIGEIFDQVLRVLEAAHAEAIVHRDMKPDNVLLLRSGDRSEHVKVLDFGIALMKEGDSDERLTATGVVQGTPLYMSPEQCRGRDVGPKTDVYAVGAMLFEAFTGQPPFSGDSATDLMVKHMFIDPPPMRTRGIGPDVSPPLEALVRRALAKKPDDRPTAAELRDELSQVVAGTDAMSFSLRAQSQRIAAANLPRDERGLPQLTRESVPTAELLPTPSLLGLPSTPSPIAGAVEGPRVVLWQFPATRAESLAAALAVQGLRAVSSSDASPPLEIDGQPVKAVVVLGDSESAGRISKLRAAAATSKVPILVLDLEKAEDTPTLIRAGASDVTLMLVGDEAVGKKLKRLIQRGR